MNKMTTLRFPELRGPLERVLGHLIFSSGTIEPAFYTALGEVCQAAGQTPAASVVARIPPAESGQPYAEFHLRSPALWAAYDILLDGTEKLGHYSPAFSDCRRARNLIELVFRHVLPGYRYDHQDLLFHAEEEELFRPFFIGKCFEAALDFAEDPAPGPSTVEKIVTRLNDYVGYRPVAVLEQVRHSTYPKERLRPVPLYLQGAGVCAGPFQTLVSTCLDILQRAPENILREAYFDPRRLRELSIDVRAYDFDHPVNKRPNYHFGLWDPDQIDNQGYYCRFVVHKMMLDALLKHVNEGAPDQRAEREFEVAGTLAGTILMGSGVSGSGPDSHDSSVTLSSLMPIIANYRDDFYEWLLETVHGQHRAKLEKEMQERRQPFGGVRQHLNAELAARRATQVQHVQLAKIFAKMGFAQAANRQASIVPVASARMICQIDCLLASASESCLQKRLRQSLQDLLEIEQTVLRGVECGAMIDPWCLLGFDGNFPLFPAIENSVADHRADDLVGIVEHTLDIYSHLLAEAAVGDDPALFEQVRGHFSRLVQWWRKYAPHEVSSLQAVDAAKILKAAELVAEALRLWKEAGASAGDVAFWARHASIFDSPKAYQLVIDALLERKDVVASQALLVHWLSQAAETGLVEGETSYHELVLAWLGLQQERYGEATGFDQREQVWQQVRKFYDYLEANAEHYWQVPDFDSEISQSSLAAHDLEAAENEAEENEEDEDEDDDEESQLYGAAYDDFVFSDSTDDGIEGQIYETDTSKQDALESEADRLIDRLSFLNTMAILWFETSHFPLPVLDVTELTPAQVEQLGRRTEVLDNWIAQAARYQSGLSRLLDQVLRMRLPKGGGEVAALMEYDRLRLIKETLMDRITSTIVDMQMAGVGLRAVRHGLSCLVSQKPLEAGPPTTEDEGWIGLFAGILTRKPEWIQPNFDAFLVILAEKPLLYVPLGRGGKPDELIATRLRQQCFHRALASLPLMGMFQATVRLLKVARTMERRNSVGFGAITEYDEMFRNGFSSMVQALVESANEMNTKQKKKSQSLNEERLFRQLEQLTESMLSAWLTHSRTLRLSVLEKVLDHDAWEQLVKFIKRYGGQIFTQDFLNVGNVRAVLHQGCEQWLRQLQDSNVELDLELLNDLEHEISLADAGRHLSVVLEGVLENFSEYRDYNSTTTQSDRGDLIYTFLDFLRLRAKYDRVAWHLKPVVWAHQVLVRNQINGVAGRWRRQLADRVESEAERYLKELVKLQSKYSMRMPTVSDRLSERFVQPLHIDRLCALVEPAIHSADRAAATGAFELLEKEAESLTKQPMGVGLEVPAWLVLLEQEVDLQRVSLPGSSKIATDSLIDPQPLSREIVQRELDSLGEM